jgi:hypothetical protein
MGFGKPHWLELEKNYQITSSTIITNIIKVTVNDLPAEQVKANVWIWRGKNLKPNDWGETLKIKWEDEKGYSSSDTIILTILEPLEPPPK